MYNISFGLFNGISTFVCYLMPKPFLKKNSSGTIQQNPYLSPPPLGQDMTQGQFLGGV